MTKASLIKITGTVAAVVAGGGAAFLPEQWRPVAVAVAALLLGWLHLPQPGTVKT